MPPLGGETELCGSYFAFFVIYVSSISYMSIEVSVFACLSCSSVVSGHSVGFICSAVCLVSVSNIPCVKGQIAVCWEGTNPNRKPTKAKPIRSKVYKGARVVIPYIKGPSEQYRHTLAKYRVRGFFKGTSTITSLLMHPTGPIPDAQKTNISYYWKC